MGNINNYVPATPTTRLTNYSNTEIIDALFQLLTGATEGTAIDLLSKKTQTKEMEITDSSVLFEVDALLSGQIQLTITGTDGDYIEVYGYNNDPLNLNYITDGADQDITVPSIYKYILVNKSSSSGEVVTVVVTSLPPSDQEIITLLTSQLSELTLIKTASASSATALAAIKIATETIQTLTPNKFYELLFPVFLSTPATNTSLGMQLSVVGSKGKHMISVTVVSGAGTLNIQAPTWNGSNKPFLVRESGSSAYILSNAITASGNYIPQDGFIPGSAVVIGAAGGTLNANIAIVGVSN